MLLVVVGVVVAFLSALSSAYRNFSHSTLDDLARRTSRQEHLGRYLSGLDRAAGVAQLVWSGGVVALVLIAYAVTVSGAPPEATWAWAEFVLVVLLVVAAAVAVPSAVAEPQAERLVLVSLPVVDLVARLLGPLYWLWQMFRRYGARLSGAPSEETPAEAIAEEILSAALEGEKEGALEQEQKEMIEGVIEFHDVPTTEVMTPRTDIVFLHAQTSLVEAQRIAMESGFSRYPVFEKSRDDVVGVLHVRGLLAATGQNTTESTVRQLMRPPYFTPETTPVGELLEDMRRRKVHLAVVLDEFGGTAGLVTLEDILEEIVGEIEDEFSPEEEEPIQVLRCGRAELSGRARIEEVNEVLGTDLPQDMDFETVGGFVFHILGHVPREGETVSHGRVKLTVLSAADRQANRLLLEIQEGEGRGEAGDHIQPQPEAPAR